MTPALHAALIAVRAGAPDVAEGAYPYLEATEQLRLDLALALRRGDAPVALEHAAILWDAMAVDATVLATLVEYDHPRLGAPARQLLERMLTAASRDLEPAWRTLAAEPGAFDPWRDVIDALVAGGRPLQAIDGVWRAMAEGVAGDELWTLLAVTLVEYRCGHALIEALRAGTVPM